MRSSLTVSLEGEDDTGEHEHSDGHHDHDQAQLPPRLQSILFLVHYTVSVL